MKAKLIKENVSNVLKPKSGSEIILARNNMLQSKKSDMDDVFTILNLVINDEQMNRGGESYEGFLNMGIDVLSPNIVKPFKTFIRLFNDQWYHSIIEEMMSDLGIYFEEEPSEDEAVFYDATTTI